MSPTIQPSSSLIGIWWDDGQTLVTLTHSPAERSSIIAGYFDSDLAHVKQWKHVAARFGKSPREEYFSVPRGRVVQSQRTGQSIVYHGSVTTQQRLEAIAAEFKLATWKASIDLHYQTGAAADKLFEDGDED
jgi:hypothetical protein